MSRRALAVRSLLVVLGIVVVAAVAVPLYAHCGKCAASGKAFASGLDKSKMTLAAGATLAEVETKGTAVRAAVHKHGDSLVIEVHCMKEGKIVAVQVDGNSGKVIKSNSVDSLEAHLE